MGPQTGLQTCRWPPTSRRRSVWLRVDGYES